jgi:signal transduction histidine kinase
MTDPLLHHLWDEAALLMLEIDSTGKVMRVSTFAEKYVGKDAEGKLFTGLIVDFTSTLKTADLSAWPQDLQRITFRVPSSNPVTFHVRFLPQADGVLAVGSPDVAGLEKLETQMLCLNQDLSNLGRELQKANANLKAMNELKSRFLGMAAHDLRTPLGAVTSFAEFLRDEAGPSLNEEHNQFIDIILQSSKRMQKLIEDFLDVSMIESGKLSLTRKPVKVSDIVGGIRTMIDPVARAKEVVLETEIDDPDLVLNVDESKIGQILINLLRNAIEYSKAGGRIWISTHQEGDNLSFSVKDEAGGIPEEQCREIFAPFGKAETKKTGGERSIGLGLSIAKKIVDAHGGVIHVDSTWGTGSTFSFKIPI